MALLAGKLPPGVEFAIPKSHALANRIITDWVQNQTGAAPKWQVQKHILLRMMELWLVRSCSGCAEGEPIECEALPAPCLEVHPLEKSSWVTLSSSPVDIQLSMECGNHSL